jgi:DNA processing protein
LTTSKESFIKLKILLETEGVGPNKILQLFSSFKTLDRIFHSSYHDLIKVDGISSNLANKILKNMLNSEGFTNKLEDEFDELENNNVKWMNYWSDEYPNGLKNIYSPPIILYYMGEIKKEDSNSIAIVGTRMATRYGKYQTEKFSKTLVQNGVTIISGLARGIDSIAHKSALKNGGRTIAVIGSGLDVIYPAENKQLFQEICKNGAVISEYQLGTKPDAQNFPKRNRIISGLSLGTLVVETKNTGGALQTAQFALDQNREIFAIPGNLDVPQSEGTNALIKKGEAKLVQDCEDILVELKLKLRPVVGLNIPKPQIDLNFFEQKVFDALTTEPKHIDSISRETNINSSDCLVHLLSMEFKDLVKQLPGKSFIKI